MKQIAYVDANGNAIEVNRDPKKMLMKIGFILAIIVIIILIIVGIIKSNRNKVCTKLEEKAAFFAYQYASDKDLLPSIGGQYVVISLEDLYSEGVLLQDDMTMEDSGNLATGNVKIINYDGDYVKVVNLENCDYCSASKRYSGWKKETTKKPKSNSNYDIVAYYNYYDKNSYDSKWTEWMASEKVSENKELNSILPTDLKKLPTIPNDAKEISYEIETTTYYRYRDQKWKFYKNGSADYTSYFSSEQPEGYALKDTATHKYSEYSQWSLDYPDKKDYRKIESKKGYRWYYTENKKKIYWNNGAYSVEQPSEEYTEHDKDSVTMYRYRDSMWRWYNGQKRVYSSFSSTMPKNYYYIDEELTEYGSWSKWSDVSNVDSSNSSYREEETDTYYRFRINYYMYSFLNQEESLKEDDFINATGLTLEDVLNDETKQLEITYKFVYRKTK